MTTAQVDSRNPTVIPSGARNLLLLNHKSRFLVAALLGMTGLGYSAPEMRRYSRAIGKVTVFLALAVLPGVATPQSHCLVVPTDYRGWKATRLSNQWISLVFVPALGGRLMQASFGGHEYLFVNPRYYGQYFPPSEGAAKGKWFNYGGDKIWPLPEGNQDESHWIVASDQLDDGIYQLRDISEGDRCAVRLEGPPDQRTGLQYSREISIDSDSPRISFHAIMKNITGHPIRWAVQSVTQYDTGDTHDRSNYNRDFWAFTPVRAASAFGRQFDVHAGPVDHPSYSVRDKRLFALHWSYLEGEVGIDSPAGWVAVVDGSSNYAMVERFSVDTKAEYPDGASVIFYLNGPTQRLNNEGMPEITSTRIEETPYYMEAELDSPLVTLLPGNTYAFDSEWLPTRGSPEFFDVTDAGVVGRPLLATRVSGGIRLRGDFGVFFPGHLVANCYDSRGDYLNLYPLVNVSPLEPALFESTIGASVECARVSIHLVDAGGLDRGSLGEAYVSEPKTP
jgi:hypothetical protein